MYMFYNANSLGKFVNDCTVRAISTAENKTWDETYRELSNMAQNKGTMMDDRYFIKGLLDSRYIRIPFVPRTVGETSGQYPDKVLLITMDGHITCSKFGIVYDSFDCRDRIVEDAWIVKD